MNITEYEAGGYARYERLAEVVAEMLRAALPQQGHHNGMLIGT
jgi:hypothetical protein